MEFNLVQKNNKTLGQVSGICSHKFGVIDSIESCNKINKIIKHYQLNERDIFLTNSKGIFKLTKVVNDYIVVKSDIDHEYEEYNPDLILFSSENCFWETIERELKISIYSTINIYDDVFSKINGYIVGPLREEYSFERYVNINSTSENMHFTILGKRNWKRRPMAIKYKENVKEFIISNSILIRKQKIFPYSEANTSNLISAFKSKTKSNVEIIKLPAFHKKKIRRICINQKTGMLFGISIGLAQLLRNKNKFIQIEIEHWSNIIQANTNFKPKWDKQLIQKEICTISGYLVKKLEQDQINYKIDGKTKWQWLMSCC